MNEDATGDNGKADKRAVKRSAAAQKRSFMEGTYIFREGETGDLAFVVLNGTVEISHVVGDKNVPIGTVTKGGMFGEMALINDKPRMASARATGEGVEVMIISREMLHSKLETADPFYGALIDILTAHVRSLADQLVKFGVRAS